MARPRARWSAAVVVAGFVGGAMALAPPAAAAPAPQLPAAAVGKRPYEMEWAGRTGDVRPALVDFEDLDGWRVEASQATATFARSREQQLWGQFVGKVAYRGAGPKGAVTLRPPKPMPLPAGADCVNLWVYGNRLGWSVDPKNPPARVGILLATGAGKDLALAAQTVNWKEWHLLHWRLSVEQTAALGEGGSLAAIVVSGVTIPEERVLYFDNLAAYKEVLEPLAFEPRPRRNLTLFAGQSPGLNTGPTTLPFPTREQTILPQLVEPPGKVTLNRQGGAYVFTYTGGSETIAYRYEPRRGDLGDVTLKLADEALEPMAGGGARFALDGSRSAPPGAAELIDCRPDGDTVVARWRLRLGERSAEVTYVLRLWQKSLVVDVLAPGGQVGEVAFGRAQGVRNARQVPVPFLNFRQAQRPLTLVFDTAAGPRFLAGYVDWYRSNASELFNAEETGESFAEYNGGARYLPRTDGRRNDCFERLFLTASSTFEETLPTIANPRSPWMEAMAQRIWRAHGASDRKTDYEVFARYARHGMTGLLVTDHETGWRDGCESFTFRTRTAPGRGGDDSQREYAKKMQALGFRYGIYNNYTDYAPVNGFWDEDNVARRPDGNWLPAWYRCYTPKPSRAVEFEARLAPVIQEKFNLSTAYCDVHTAVAPWQKEDYDARVPGAGTFAATFYAYGELLLHQRRTWNGPTYSEGGAHWIYTGLTDGNYGQDEPARLPTQPWLVDFDLLRMHPLGATFGMGNPEMFFGHRTRPLSDPAARDPMLDLFLAATVAFGHTGFFVTEGGLPGAARSYFMLQGPQQHYANAEVERIRYAAADGALLDTSKAIATGAYERRQIRTTYRGGCVTLVNGHPSQPWVRREGTLSLELPPASYAILQAPAGEAGGAAPKVLAFSGVIDGHRADFAQSVQYTYCDGRGMFTGFEGLDRVAASDGALIVLHHKPGEDELIPLAGCGEFGVAVPAGEATAVALDAERKEIGPAEVRRSRGLAYVQLVKGAMSYRLTSSGKAPARDGSRWRAVPGEQAPAGAVPASARPGRHVWLAQPGGGWADFVVVPLVREDLRVAGEHLALVLTSNLPRPARATVRLAGESKTVDLPPGDPVLLQYAPGQTADGARSLPLVVEAGGLRHESSWTLTTKHREMALLELPRKPQVTQCLRKGAEEPLSPATGASFHPGQLASGGVTREGLFMHPPYKQGVGYIAAQYAVQLPARPAALRCSIGKQDGSDRGDGVLFRIEVVEGPGAPAVVVQKQWAEHAWTELEADLSKWAGKRVRLRLVADVGPANNSSGDWACWSGMRVETLNPVAVSAVERAGR